MSARQATLLAVVVVVAAGLVVAPAVGTTGTAPTPAAVAQNGTDDGTSGGDGPSVGAQLSSFVQASSADADGSVERGMWGAKFNDTNGSERDALVGNRVATLERRQERLRDRMRDLETAHENGTLPEPAYLARASSVAERIDALEAAIDQTERAAGRAGVDAERLGRLRTEARNMTGREVARVARNVTAVSPPGLADGPAGPPADVERGPGSPDDVGPPGADESAGGPGRSGDGGANETGPPDGGARGGPGPGGDTGNGSGEGDGVPGERDGSPGDDSRADDAGGDSRGEGAGGNRGGGNSGGGPR